MNRLAVFVEGYTEVVFMKRLFEEVAGKRNVLIEHRRNPWGPHDHARTMRLVEALRPDRRAVTTCSSFGLRRNEER